MSSRSRRRPLRSSTTFSVIRLPNGNTVVFADDPLLGADVALELNHSVILFPLCALVVPDNQEVPTPLVVWGDLEVVSRGGRTVTLCKISDENTEKLWSSMGMGS